MPQIIALDAFTTDHGDEAIWTPVAELGDFRRHDRSLANELHERIGQADCILTNKVPVDAALLRDCPSLRYVGVLATGVDHIDLAACRDASVAVANVPGYSTDSVAQLTIAYLLHHAVGVHRHDQAVRAGAWQHANDFCFTIGDLQELATGTLLLIGQGAIGSAVRRIAEALGMRVLAAQVPGSTHKPDRLPLEEALPQADYISLHCPLTDRTRHLVDAAFINRCRSEAVLINTGRGALIDDAALRFALDNGLLAQAYVDVLDREPPPGDHPLLGHDRVTMTPHIGWATRQARQRLVREVAANLAAFSAGKERNRVDR